MKKNAIFLFVFLAAFRLATAGEGMWLPLLLEQLNEKEMKSMGMRISAEDIYSINNSSLKDAILLFGRGCTAEIVSDKGLILTNHHCGYGQIQSHSSLEHDYLTNGFWAMNQSEELPNPGLSVTLLVRMEDVTSKVLQALKPGMSESQREAAIREISATLEQEAVKGTHYKAVVKPFYYGNEFYMFVSETFNDVRLVGAPPSNIGKFGGDTDNWMWPRHTGDFSIFRIYANKNNEPAEYSADNVPYTPKSHLKISLKGAEKGDFTFVFGYPGTTQEYLPSNAIQMITQQANPPAIRLRGKRLAIFDKYQNESNLVRIQYAAKHASVANYWKKMIGENRGIQKLDAINKKQELENGFKSWAASDAGREKMYGGILPAFDELYGKMGRLEEDQTYLIEAGLGIEAVRFAYGFNTLLIQSTDKKVTDEAIDEQIKKLRTYADAFFKNYYAPIDHEVFIVLMQDWFEHQEGARMPGNLTMELLKHGNSFTRWADVVFEKSMFTDQQRLNKFLDRYNRRKARQIEVDPMFSIAEAIYGHYIRAIRPSISGLEATNDSLQRIYMRGLMEYQPDKRFYPDANSTLRVTYGKVDDYSPRDAVDYRYYTTLEGIMEKEDPAIYDYVVEPKLKKLYREKDYGRYGDRDGTMHVCFTASNHTSVGNSGSPVLNADGYLLGINFDRNWEGTMSDLMYDPDQCRNISIDIRYCLFIVDKFAGAGHLVNEMTIVE
ncbi:MAG: S46 family peptidase [Lentimicrobiaceae bacterium]|nr:S46 family peptidase [Lentimicrobiaceae bacterium]